MGAIGATATQTWRTAEERPGISPGETLQMNMPLSKFRDAFELGGEQA